MTKAGVTGVDENNQVLVMRVIFARVSPDLGRAVTRVRTAVLALEVVG